VTALYDRDHSGVGRLVEVAMQETVWPTLAASYDYYYRTGEIPPRTGNRQSGLNSAPYNVFPAADGYVAIHIVTEAHWQNLLKAMGRDDLADDPRFATNSARVAHMEETDALIEAWTRSLGKMEVFARTKAYRIPCAPVRTAPEVMNDPHMHERGMLERIDHPELGAIVVPTTPLRLHGTDRVAAGPSPTVGRHNAGGDLASLRTRAVDGGDHFVTNAQKVWTSGVRFADWCFLLVRTDPDAPKHHGISYLLVDMETPGIKVRPAGLLNGHRHFNEIFFEDVVIPKENLVGPLNHGWKVAITTLMFERSAQPVALAAEMGRRRAAGVRHDRRLLQNARRLRKPIGSYQGVKHPAADMLVALENAKSVTYYAVWAVDRGLDEVPLAVSMAKAAASDMSGKVAGTGIQLHGASA